VQNRHTPQIAPQLPDNGDVEHIGGKARPQLAAQQREGWNIPLHLPARRDAPREVKLVGNDQDSRRFHGASFLFYL
jgi:hypothetical protein